jgi:zinc and cadmium transporter
MNIWMYLLLLFVITLGGGSIPLLYKQFKSTWITLLLAFSGSFLLGIVTLHLMPETFHELGEKAGLFILGGFFLQLILQRLSHGIEHGHVHEHEHGAHHHSLAPIFLGLCIHAFMEGIPLGFNYQNAETLPSIFFGVAAHKIPEAITLSSMLLASNTKTNKWMLVSLFALVSPISGIMAMYYGQKFYFISNLLVYIIPVVIGAFLHISTTILYESGTKRHELSRQKVMAVLLGLGFALSTLLLHSHH